MYVQISRFSGVAAVVLYYHLRLWFYVYVLLLEEKPYQVAIIIIIIIITCMLLCSDTFNRLVDLILLECSWCIVSLPIGCNNSSCDL